MTDEKNIGTEEGVADAVDQFNTDTLAGDIRDFLLERLRWEQDRRPWSDRSEEDQQTTIDEAYAAGKLIVQRVVRMIAAENRDPIIARLKTVKADGDKIEAQAILSKADPHRHALLDATGASVMIMVVDSEDYEGEREPVALNPDQRDLGFDPETGEIREPEGGEAQKEEAERIGLSGAEDAVYEEIFAFCNEDGSFPTLPKNEWPYGKPEAPWFVDEPTAEDIEREGAAVMCRRPVMHDAKVGDPMRTMWSTPIRQPQEQSPAEGE